MISSDRCVLTHLYVSFAGDTCPPLGLEGPATHVSISQAPMM